MGAANRLARCLPQSDVEALPREVIAALRAGQVIWI